MGQTAFNLFVTADNLSPERAGMPIVTGVSFSLVPGDALIVRGSNGAGKTTLLRALAGFSRLNSGELRFQLEGEPAHQKDIESDHIHYLGHENGLCSKLSILENLTFWARFLTTQKPSANPEILSQIGLGAKAHVPAGQLSAGQQRRLAMARLITVPRALWLLDEPATALDHQGQGLMQDIAAQHRAQGGIIITTTHGSFSLPKAKGLLLDSEAEEGAR